MKHFKSIVALLLVFVMVLSCVGTAFATEKSTVLENKTKISEAATTKEPVKAEKSLKGFQSEKFKELNSYEYGDDETVRAIVILESAPEADVAENGSEKAASYRVKLVNEHNAVWKAMAGIDYELKYDFTAVLNGFSCDVAYGDLDAISAIKGVEAVYIANSYAAPVLTEEHDSKMAVSNQMTGNDYSFDEEFYGAGTVIAILDTGLRTTHEAFSDGGNICGDYATLTEDDLPKVETEGVYVSAKIPFAYDYADKDADVTDNNGHGTHVAGIAAGWTGEYLEEEGGYSSTFSGAAPGAQILAMKIFSDTSGGTTSDIYYQAIEDAYLLGADVVSMSIGAQNGFTYDSTLETEVYGNIYKRMEEAGIIMSIAAGNEYSMAYHPATGYIGPEYPDFGTVATPSTYEGNVSVASVENAAYPSTHTVDVAGAMLEYYDSTDADDDLWRSTFAGQTLDFVLVSDGDGNLSLGTPADLTNADVEGKVAVVSRGDLSFEEKVENAANAGAIGCIVVNNEAGVIYMSIETYEVPAVTMTMDALEVLASSTSGQFTVSEKAATVENPSGWLMSEFSNWGTTPMLTIDPAITSVGGMVYSSYLTGDDAYEVMSGTSMATPNMSGTYANIISFLDFWGQYNPETNDFDVLDKVERAQRAKDLLESTAYILTDAKGYPYSVRKQGAGMAATDYALDSYAYSAYISDPLKELGDDPAKTGVYSFDITLNSATYYDTVYNDLQAVVMYDYLEDVGTEEAPIIANSLTSDIADADVSITLDGEEVDSVTVPAGGSVTVSVTIELTEDMKNYFDTYYENGAFVEGYIIFNEVDTEDNSVFSSSHATFLAFYGDWTQAPAMEEADFRDMLDYFDTGAMDFSFYTNPNMAYTMNYEEQQLVYYLGGNIFVDTPFREEYISITTPYSNGSFYWADTIYMEPYLLRNARHLVMTVSNAKTGEVYYVDDTEYLPKSAYDEVNGYWAAYGVFMWDGTDMNGDYVPAGTVAHIQYDAVLPYTNGGTNEVEDGTLQENVWSFDVTVDTTAPVIEDVVYDEETATLTVSASDDRYLQAVYLMSNDYTTVYDVVGFSPETEGETMTGTFDLTELLDAGIDSFFVTALDYATNESEEFTYVGNGTFKPVSVTLVTPAGETTYNGHSGDSFTFPEVNETYEGYEFVLWSETDVAKATDKELESLGDMYYPGETITVRSDVTFYALFGKGEIVPLEVANYYASQASDYTGDWAIVGLNANAANTGYNYVEPQALSVGCEQVDVASLPNTIVDDYYVQFFTNEKSIRWSFQQVSEGIYTIQNSVSGEYLALVGENLITTATAGDTALWNVEADPLMSLGTLVYNAAQPSMLLTYDHWEECFAIYDDYELYSGYYYPSQIFGLFLYTCVDAELIAEYYTTRPGAEDACQHENTEIRDAKEATCTEPGYTGDTYCLVCGEKIAEGELIEATGHSYGEWTVTIPATAAKDGEETRTCSVCGETETRAIPALGYGECYFDDFSDCKDAWYHEAVDFAVANKLMNGVGNGKFDPSGSLTRAMVVTVLYRQAGSPAVAEASTFTDVSGDEWYADAIAWAQDNGVVNGVSATEFAPTADVTREQIAAILWRYAGSPKVEADMSSFKDANEVSDYAKTAMAWAVSEGIFQGDETASLNPTDSATRAEFTCIIMRYLEGSYDCANLG